MLPKIQKILYATDLSENARHALGYAAMLASALNAKITVLHVVEDLSATGKALILDYLGEEKWNDLMSHRHAGYV